MCFSKMSKIIILFMLIINMKIFSIEKVTYWDKPVFYEGNYREDLVKLYGMIKEIVFVSDYYIFNNNEYIEYFSHKSFYKFDKYGNQIESGLFDKQDKISEIYKKQYDENREEIEKTKIVNNEKKISKKNIEKILDENNNIIEVNIYTDNNKLIDKEIYNNKGWLIQSISYFSDSRVNWNNIYKYDNNGNLIKEINYRDIDKNKLEFRHTYKYDKNNNKIEDLFFGENNKLLSKMTFQYDDDSRMIDKKEFWSDGKLRFHYTYKFDKDGKILEQVDYKGKLVYKYDKHNQLIETVLTRIGYDKVPYVFEKEFYYYNFKKKLIKKEKISYYRAYDYPAESFEVWIYKYDKKNNLIKSKYEIKEKYKESSFDPYKNEKKGIIIEQFNYLYWK